MEKVEGVRGSLRKFEKVKLSDSSSNIVEFGTGITSVAQMRAEQQRLKVRVKGAESHEFGQYLRMSDSKAPRITWMIIHQHP